MDTGLRKLKDAVKDNAVATLLNDLKMINASNLQHELLLTERQSSNY